ncbi:MAG: hypothetical protein HQM14_21455, partial [SAR324 cluster bacterium]|nr:hypothetical protein [SAR324 cluster bacterium]
MNNRLKHAWVAVMLVPILLLSSCSDELITRVKGDPTPNKKEGEEKLTAAEHLTAKKRIVAQLSTDSGRVPLPNDLILSSINSSRIVSGEKELNGMDVNIPIRIPFTGSVDVPAFDYATESGINAAISWASNIVIVRLGPSDAAVTGIRVVDQAVPAVTSIDAEVTTTSEPFITTTAEPTVEVTSFPEAEITTTSAVIPFFPLPTQDANGHSINMTVGEIPFSGKFKAVYQDANYDLVLVPETTTANTRGTFEAGSKYAVIVKKSLKEGLIEDSLFAALKSDEPLYKNTTVTNPLLAAQATELETVIGLESIRQGYAAVLAATSTNKSEVAIMQTFTTQYSSASEVAATTALVRAMNTNAADVTAAASSPITWFTETAISTSSDNAFDLKAIFEAGGAPVGSINKILGGYYPCQGFLANSGTTTSPQWALDLINRAASPLSDCPNTNGFDGNIEFLVSIPAATTGVVIYQHGITRNKNDFAAVANAFAGAGLATIAIDAWNHGTRTYEDADGDGTVEPTTSTDSTSPGDSGLSFLRPDDPSLTTGYVVQTLMDITQLTIMLKANSSLLAPMGLSVAGDGPTIHFVGHSLGGIFGSILGSSGSLPYTRVVLNAAGADLTDIVLNGDTFGTLIKLSVASKLGLDYPSADLNKTMLGIELGTYHALASGSADPLVTVNKSLPGSVLLQEITGDGTISNSNSKLLAIGMGLTSKNDGDGAVSDTSTRVRWTFDPDNYAANASINPDNEPAGHGFLIDGKT